MGRVLTAEVLEGTKKPAYRLTVDFGVHIGTKQSSAQITEHDTVDGVVLIGPEREVPLGSRLG